MKIGIITYHTALNFGAVLQTYALQNVISSKLNCQCEIINYHCEYLDEIYEDKKIYQMKNVKEVIKWIITHKHKKKSNIEFKKFREKYLVESNKEYRKNNIINANKNYDIFITGSDQVWNSNLNKEDTTYFLDFVENDKAKLSYAASFGAKKCTKFVEKNLTNFLNDYDMISVREKEAIDIIKDLNIKKDVCQVLDPTLLLDKNKWDSLAGDRIINEPYIVVYKIADTPTLLDFARELAKKHKCKIICLHGSYKNYSGMKNITDASPIEFINYIKYAEFVVTSSFHGICFSLNFQKDFYYELDKNKNNNNSRIISLIDSIGLSSREINNGYCNDSKSIDYSIVNKKLQKEIGKSINFIERIGDIYEK